MEQLRRHRDAYMSKKTAEYWASPEGIAHAKVIGLTQAEAGTAHAQAQAERKAQARQQAEREAADRAAAAEVARLAAEEAARLQAERKAAMAVALERTLATSNFNRAYNEAKKIPFKGVGEMFAALAQLLQHYCRKHGIQYRHGEGQHFFQELQAEAVENADELVQGEAGICQAVQRMWTSTLTLRGMEFCSILNGAVREDSAALADNVADMCRAINQLCVTANGQTIAIHPEDNVCYRGGGFDDRYRDFFVAGWEFRQPAFLATSFLLATTAPFIARSKAPSRVLWCIHIDPNLKCRHVNLVTKRVPGLPDEREYLFAPYSVFTVRSVQWRAGTREEPHRIDLDAAVDNVGPSEELPLAPWS